MKQLSYKIDIYKFGYNIVGFQRSKWRNCSKDGYQHPTQWVIFDWLVLKNETKSTCKFLGRKHSENI